MTRLLWRWSVEKRLQHLDKAGSVATLSAARLGVRLAGAPTEELLASYRAALQRWKQRLEAAKKVLTFRRALEMLKRGPSFEDIAQQRSMLAEQVAQNSSRLWRDWVQLAPTRLSAAQRKDVADYAAALQLIKGYPVSSSSPEITV